MLSLSSQNYIYEVAFDFDFPFSYQNFKHIPQSLYPPEKLVMGKRLGKEKYVCSPKQTKGDSLYHTEYQAQQ